ncbi:MAG: hypothetical protein P9X27_00260 [Candidatus Kaelpia aquatica]|nr:hypothetical protein [Candidatus Kaelpia aquatica]
MKKNIVPLLMLFALGCASKPQMVTMYTHHPIFPKGNIALNAGMDLFQDLRPEEEKEHTERLSNLDEELTVLITGDLRDAELFNSIRITYQPENVDIIIRGEINSFYWKSSIAPTAKLPYIKYIHDIGIKSGAGKGKVAITFIVLNARDKTEICRYEERAKMERKYSSHEAQSSGSETAEALREVVEKFIEKILSNKELILLATAIK